MTTSTIDRETLEHQRLTYIWYHKYEQWCEYQWEPEWSEDTISRVHKGELLICDTSEERAYIKSEDYVDLNQMT